MRPRGVFSAASSISKLKVSPADAGAKSDLTGALRDAAAAYKKAASEGKSKDRNGYKREGGKAVAAGKDIKAAAGDLTDAGYKLPGGTANVTKLPVLKKDPVKKSAPPKPERAIENLREDVAAVKGGLHS